MKMNKIALLSLMFAMPVTMTANATAAIGVAEKLLDALLIGSAASPLISAHAGYQRRGLEEKLANYKKTLTPEELAAFNEKYKHTDTWLLTSSTLPLFAISTAAGFISKAPTPFMAGSTALSLICAGSAKYIERQNTKRLEIILLEAEVANKAKENSLLAQKANTITTTSVDPKTSSIQAATNTATK